MKCSNFEIDFCCDSLFYSFYTYSFIIVAQWSERSPFTSEVAGSILSENVVNASRTQCSTHVKRVKVSQHSAESRGFSSGAPVRPTGKVDRVG